MKGSGQIEVIVGAAERTYQGLFYLNFFLLVGSSGWNGSILFEGF